MVNLVMMFVAGLAIGHGNPLKDDVGRDGRFAVDQRGKYVVYHVETLPSKVNFAEVKEQLTTFLDAKGNETVLNDAARLESKGSIPMKKHAGIGNYVAGTINYTLVVEESDGELNYWFTDLTYQPYRNDRYGKRVKATSSPIPLEKQMSKVNDQVWKKQRAYAYDEVNELADELQAQLMEIGKPKVINTDRTE